MSRVSELIKNLLNESFVRRLDDIEKRFTREGTDITQLENNVDSLKSISNFYHYRIIERV